MARQFGTGCLRTLVFLGAIAVGWLIGEAVTSQCATAAESPSQPAPVTVAAASSVDSRTTSVVPVLTELLTPIVKLTEPANPVLAPVIQTVESGSSLDAVLHPIEVSNSVPLTLHGPSETGHIGDLDIPVTNNAAVIGPNKSAALVPDVVPDDPSEGLLAAVSSIPVPTGHLAAVPAAGGGAFQGPQTGASTFAVAAINEYAVPEMNDGDVVGASMIAPASSWLLADPSLSPD